MQEVLKGIEDDASKKFDQQFYGDLAYKNWLSDKGLTNKKKPTTKDAEEINKKGKSYSEPYHKANSIRPMSAAYSVSTPKSRLSQKREDLQSQNDIQLNVEQDTEEGLEKTEDEEKKKVEQSFVNHEKPWNPSPHTVPNEYVPNLPDYYPRDEFTKKPKYPLRKGGKPTPDKDMVPMRYERLSAKSKLRKPKLPPEMLEQMLMDRPVVYKCKNIIDVHKRKHYTSEVLPKSEVAIHLSEDPTSALYRAALQNKQKIISQSKSEAAMSTLSSSSKSSSASKLAAGDQFGINIDVSNLTQLMRQMNKPRHYPQIKGKEYDLNLGQVAAI